MDAHVQSFWAVDRSGFGLFNSDLAERIRTIKNVPPEEEDDDVANPVPDVLVTAPLDDGTQEVYRARPAQPWYCRCDYMCNDDLNRTAVDALMATRCTNLSDDEWNLAVRATHMWRARSTTWRTTEPEHDCWTMDMLVQRGLVSSSIAAEPDILTPQQNTREAMCARAHARYYNPHIFACTIDHLPCSVFHTAPSQPYHVCVAGMCTTAHGDTWEEVCTMSNLYVCTKTGRFHVCDTTTCTYNHGNPDDVDDSEPSRAWITPDHGHYYCPLTSRLLARYQAVFKYGADFRDDERARAVAEGKCGAAGGTTDAGILVALRTRHYRRPRAPATAGTRATTTTNDDDDGDPDAVVSYTTGDIDARLDFRDDPTFEYAHQSIRGTRGLLDDIDAEDDTTETATRIDNGMLCTLPSVVCIPITLPVVSFCVLRDVQSGVLPRVPALVRARIRAAIQRGLATTVLRNEHGETETPVLDTLVASSTTVTISPDALCATPVIIEALACLVYEYCFGRTRLETEIVARERLAALHTQQMFSKYEATMRQSRVNSVYEVGMAATHEYARYSRVSRRNDGAVRRDKVGAPVLCHWRVHFVVYIVLQALELMRNIIHYAAPAAPAATALVFANLSVSIFAVLNCFHRGVNVNGRACALRNETLHAYIPRHHSTMCAILSHDGIHALNKLNKVLADVLHVILQQPIAVHMVPTALDEFAFLAHPTSDVVGAFVHRALARHAT